MDFPLRHSTTVDANRLMIDIADRTCKDISECTAALKYQYNYEDTENEYFCIEKLDCRSEDALTL